MALGLAVAALILISGLGLVLYFFLSNPYLGVYKGSLAEFFPQSVGDFQLSSSAEENDAKEQLGATEGWLAIYKNQTTASGRLGFQERVQAREGEASSLAIMALNYPSIESAKAGLQNLKKVLGDASVIDQGRKRKGVFTVGERLVLIPPKDVGRREVELPGSARLIQAQRELLVTPNSKAVAWTNGSVLFFVLGEGDIPLEVERGFRY